MYGSWWFTGTWFTVSIGRTREHWQASCSLRSVDNVLHKFILDFTLYFTYVRILWSDRPAATHRTFAGGFQEVDTALRRYTSSLYQCLCHAASTTSPTIIIITRTLSCECRNVHSTLVTVPITPQQWNPTTTDFTECYINCQLRTDWGPLRPRTWQTYLSPRLRIFALYTSINWGPLFSHWHYNKLTHTHTHVCTHIHANHH